jgi:hypothetical protein
VRCRQHGPRSVGPIAAVEFVGCESIEVRDIVLEPNDTAESTAHS